MLVPKASAIVNNEILTILPSIAPIKTPIEVMGRIRCKGKTIVFEGGGMEASLELIPITNKFSLILVITRITTKSEKVFGNSIGRITKK
jgi:hypothetical protein